MPDTQGDDGSPPRKRIAVACGRCRKRKIRCSGDFGSPCHNCKSAGVDQQCLFLRVQSQEAPMRDDGRGYDYNIDVSRSLAQRAGAGSMAQQVATSMAQYPTDMHLLSSGGLPASYRGHSYGHMGAAKAAYYPMGGEWADAYGADGGGVDYGLSCPPYPVLHGDMVPGYGQWNGAGAGGARHKTSASQQGHSVYLESAEAGYGYGTGSPASLVHRPAVSVAGGGGAGGGADAGAGVVGGGSDSSAYSMSSIAASLASTGASGNERLLPTPVSRTLGSSSASHYRTDGLPSGYGGCSSTNKSSHGTAVSSGGGAEPASPVSTMADVTAAAVAAAAVAGYTSAGYDYTNTVVRASQQQHHGSGGGGSGGGDAYSSVVSSAGPETIFGDSDRHAATQGSAVDLTGYTYGAGAGAGAVGAASTGAGSGTGTGPGSPAETTSSMRRASSGSGLTTRSAANSSPASTATYMGSDGGSYHHAGSSSNTATAASSSHRHHHSSSNSNSHSHHHAAPRHGSSRHHHLSQHQQQHPHQHVVTGVTYGDAPGSGSASHGVSHTAVGDGGHSHRTSLPGHSSSRR